MDLDVTSLHHRRAVHRWDRMSVGDLIERVTWSRPDKVALAGRPGAYADERFAALTYRQAEQAANQIAHALLDRGLGIAIKVDDGNTAGSRPSRVATSTPRS